jgi:hypothetical protein
MRKRFHGLVTFLATVASVVTLGGAIGPHTPVAESGPTQGDPRRRLRALLDSAMLVRATPASERAYMRRVAQVLAELPDTIRGPRIIRSVDDAALALEEALKPLGMAKAIVTSNPLGLEATFRRVYDTTAAGFVLTANDSQLVDPAWYHVVCKRPGRRPADAQRKDCTSVCRVVCQAPR